MDKNANSYVAHNEVVNAPLSSRSYNIYSTLRNPKPKLNVKSTALCLVFIASMLLCILIFVLSIRAAYFNRTPNSTTGHTSIVKTKSSYDANPFLKIETVTEEIADVFDIPVGVKVIGFSDDSYVSAGLKINDIIVKVSGEPISSIDEFNNVINSLSAEDIPIYTIYRNGDYKYISPYDIEE